MAISDLNCSSAIDQHLDFSIPRPSPSTPLGLMALDSSGDGPRPTEQTVQCIVHFTTLQNPQGPRPPEQSLYIVHFTPMHNHQTFWDPGPRHIQLTSDHALHILFFNAIAADPTNWHHWASCGEGLLPVDHHSISNGVKLHQRLQTSDQGFHGDNILLREQSVPAQQTLSGHHYLSWK